MHIVVAVLIIYWKVCKVYAASGLPLAKVVKASNSRVHRLLITQSGILLGMRTKFNYETQWSIKGIVTRKPILTSLRLFNALTFMV